MSSVVYAKFNYMEANGPGHPDVLDLDSGAHDDFVVSRNKDGTVLSRYGDGRWDFLPYSRVSLSVSTVDFHSWIPNKNLNHALSDSIVRQLKQIMLTEIYMSDVLFSTQTMLSRFFFWRKFAKAIFLQGKCFETAQDQHYMPFMRDELRRNLSYSQHFMPRLRFAKKHMPGPLVNFSMLSDHAYSVINEAALEALALYKNEKATQTTVIPSRIYSELIVAANEYITDFNKVSNSLFDFLRKCNENPAYGRNHNMQMVAIKKMFREGTYPHADKMPLDSRGFCWWQKFDRFEPDFYGAATDLGLDAYFSKYRVHGLKSVKLLLTDVQRAAMLNIELFTGARESEVSCLPFGCLSTIQLDGAEHVLISGRSSKMQQKITAAEWIADTSTIDAVRAAQTLTAFVCENSKMPVDDNGTPLFLRVCGIPCLYGGEQILKSEDANSSMYAHPIGQSVKTVKRFLDRFPAFFKISESDLNEVIDIDPHYGYSEDDRFQVGSTWPLSDHQMRRSLVAYAFNDGIDHPDLKWQLKHMSLSMTLWYGRNGAFAKSITQRDDHIYKDYQEAIAEYDASQYLANVISEEIKLHGTHGVFISNMIVKHGYDETRRLVSRGELAYKETPIGGCVSTSGCSMDAFINITSCIPCKNAVFTTNDLPKIDRAISHIERIAEASEDQSQAKVSSRLQLTELNRLKSKVTNNA